MILPSGGVPAFAGLDDVALEQHSESWFPKSVDGFLKWTSLSEPQRRTLLWDNAVRCYRRYKG